jgi:hypothetical protein
VNDPNATTELDLRDSDMFSRRLALFVLAAGLALAHAAPFASPGAAQSQSQQPKGVSTMNQSAVNEIVRGGGSLVVAQWEAKEGQAEAVAAILRRDGELLVRDPLNHEHMNHD